MPSSDNPLYFCCCMFMAPIWPIVSIAFGIVGGTISSAITTLIVTVMALLHFPLYLWKTLYTAATTDQSFKGVQGNLIWRLPVLLLSPIGPILFLLFGTVVSATIGTLWQIGIATGVVYDHDYATAAKNAKSNLRLENESLLREFLDQCQKLFREDDFAITTCNTIKSLLTTVVSFCFAWLAFIPFSIAMVAVTVFRLPINFFKTMKIAIFTVMLRWDLRIVVLVMLPLIHTVFPVVVLVVSMIGSFFWTWAQTQDNLFQDKNPFREWSQLLDAVKDFYEEHKKFVSKRCDPYDHPSGIPMGWNGQQYGLEIERIVRFQLNFLLCVTLMLYQTPIILAGAAVIVLIKYVPACLRLWEHYCKSCICDSGSNCVVVLSVWPFHVLAIALIPLGTVLAGAGFIAWVILESYWQVVQLIFDEHAPLCVCLSVPLAQIRRCDAYTAKYFVDNENFRLVTKGCCPCSKISIAEDESRQQLSSSSSRRETLNADIYWDKFASQCIQSTSELLANGFLDYELIEDMDPACVQSIPSVAAFAILLDTRRKDGLKHGDIYWKVDETVCAQKGRAPLDNIAALLWPMVLDILDFLKKHKKTLAEDGDSQDILAIQALLCDNQDSDKPTEAIQKALDMISEKQRALSNQLRTKIVRLVLAILRVRPFQERMTKIFEYKYEHSNKTMKDIESQPLYELGDEDMVSVATSIEGEEAEAGPNGEADEDVHTKSPSVFTRMFGSD